MRHVQKRYDAAGSKLFEEPNAIYALREILSDILNDSILPTTYLIVDALDECTTGLPALLRIITDRNLGRQPTVKWVVTSRNMPEVERCLRPDPAGIKVSLEISARQISEAVAAFISFKVQRLVAANNYDTELQAEVQQVLRERAEGTFLWVSLVCKELEGVPLFCTRQVLQAMPTGLDPLYERMMTQTTVQKHIATAKYCKAVLRAVTVAFRPLHLLELGVVAGLPGNLFNSVESVYDLITRCGSFLTVRDKTVSFIHLSAQDYFISGNGQQIFDGTVAEEHRQVTLRLLGAMRRTLRRDLCDMEKSESRIEGVVDWRKHDTLAQIAYACEYWIDHLCDPNLTSPVSSGNFLGDGGVIDLFLREKFLYWLEALSLCGSMSKGIVLIEKLWLLTQEDTSALAKLIKDAHRFAMYHKGAIEASALQVYASGLLFSPKKSLMRNLFRHEQPDYITIVSGIRDNWSACLQTLEGHSDTITSVVFSHNSTQLASAAGDNTVRIWDARTGRCLRILEGHSRRVSSVAFTHDSTRLVSGSHDGTIKIWDAGSSGGCLQTLEGHNDSITSVVFSHNSTQLASAAGDNNVRIWDARTGRCLRTLEGHSCHVSSMAFSHDSMRLASASYDGTIKIWDVSSGACLRKLKDHSPWVYSVTFSHDSTRLASASSEVKIWDVSSGVCLQTLEGFLSVAFSHDSTRLASLGYDMTIEILDVSSGDCLQTLEGHYDDVWSLDFSHDSTWLASASKDMTVKIWDVSSCAPLQIQERHSSRVNSVTFSHDSTRLASASNDHTVKIWDVSSGACLWTLDEHDSWVSDVVFSHDSTRLVSASSDNTVKIWDTNSGDCLQTFVGHSDSVERVAFSYDSTQIASVSYDEIVKLWDADSGVCLQTWAVREMVFDIHSDATGFRLRTGTGTFIIHAPSTSLTISPVTESEGSKCQSLGLDENKAWITYNSKRLMWLPSEFRPSCSAVSGNTIAIGVGNGRVWICKVELDML